MSRCRRRAPVTEGGGGPASAHAATFGSFGDGGRSPASLRLACSLPFPGATRALFSLLFIHCKLNDSFLQFDIFKLIHNKSKGSVQEKSYFRRTVKYRYINECYPSYFSPDDGATGRGARGCLPLHVSGRRGEGGGHGGSSLAGLGPPTKAPARVLVPSCRLCAALEAWLWRWFRAWGEAPCPPRLRPVTDRIDARLNIHCRCNDRFVVHADHCF